MESQVLSSPNLRRSPILLRSPYPSAQMCPITRKQHREKSYHTIHLNPKVCLERLRVLEQDGHQSCRFYLDNGIIKRQPVLRKSNNKNVLKFSCMVVLVVTSIIYWTDDIKRYGLRPIENTISTFREAVTKLCFDAVETRRNDSNQRKNVTHHWDQCPSLQNYTTLPNSLEIRKMVRDHIAELRRKNLHNRRTPKSFIEEQCDRQMGSALAYHFQVPKSDVTRDDYLHPGNITDYALESQGAKIVSIFDTEPYGDIAMKFLNFRLGSWLNFLMKYFTAMGPPSILVPWKKAGDCWAFRGSSGRVQIQLSQRIIITAVAVDHISKDRSPNGNINSAPKTFSVIGIDVNGEEKSSRTHLGEYEYKLTGPSLQTFPIKVNVERPFNNVEFIFRSNHGNDKYTCVYKIRVHGYK